MQPIAQITRLTEGFVLATDTESIACSSVEALAKAIRRLFRADPNRGQIIPFPPRGVTATPEQIKAALTNQPPEGFQAPPVSAPPGNPPVVETPAERVPPIQLPQDQINNLMALADAVYRGKLPKPDILPNLQKYVPHLAPGYWDLFYSEYAADRRGEESGD